MPAPIHKLRDHLAPIEDLKAAAAVLRWDQETYMPEGGGEARAQQLSTLQSAARSSNAPVSSATKRSWAVDCSVESCWARASPPPSGMYVS